MRWAVPLLKNPHAIPQDHNRCAEAPCIACEAEQHLVSADWLVVEFYRRVSDQVMVLSGAYAEELYWAPRLEGWESVLRIYRYPTDTWEHLVLMSRILHDALHGRLRLGEAYKELPQDLVPVSMECSDG